MSMTFCEKRREFERLVCNHIAGNNIKYSIGRNKDVELCYAQKHLISAHMRLVLHRIVRLHATRTYSQHGLNVLVSKQTLSQL